MSRRDDVVRAAARLFASKGIQATTMRELGEAAGILHSSLYSHIESKEALADEVIREYLEQLIEQWRQASATSIPPTERLRQLISATLHAVRDHPEVVSILQRDGPYLATLPRFAYLRELRDAGRTIWLEAMQDGVARGELRADVDPELAYRWVRDATWSTVRWYRPDGPLDVDELADTAARLFLDGLRQPTAQAGSDGNTAPGRSTPAASRSPTRRRAAPAAPSTDGIPERRRSRTADGR